MGTQTEIAAMMNFRWFCSDPWEGTVDLC